MFIFFFFLYEWEQIGHNVPFPESASLRKRKRNAMKRIKQTYLKKSWPYFYQELLKEKKNNPRLKGNRKGIIVKDKEFYIPILNTFPTR